MDGNVRETGAMGGELTNGELLKLRLMLAAPSGIGAFLIGKTYLAHPAMGEPYGWLVGAITAALLLTALLFPGKSETARGSSD